MGRRKIHIDDALKEVICTLHDQKKDSREILKHLNDQYSFTISRNVLQTRLKAWGKKRYHTQPFGTTCIQDIKTAIMHLFVNMNATDNMILVDLRSQGFPIQRRKLRRLRLEMGLRRRRDNAGAVMTESLALFGNGEIHC